MSTQFDKILPLLVNGNVEFVLIGGVAGNIHGSARLTFDKLSTLLKPLSPYLRGAPPGLPFKLDLPTLNTD
jgi:hypothetical protein